MKILPQKYGTTLTIKSAFVRSQEPTLTDLSRLVWLPSNKNSVVLSEKSVHQWYHVRCLGPLTGDPAACHRFHCDVRWTSTFMFKVRCSTLPLKPPQAQVQMFTRGVFYLWQRQVFRRWYTSYHVLTKSFPLQPLLSPDPSLPLYQTAMYVGVCFIWLRNLNWCDLARVILPTGYPRIQWSMVSKIWELPCQLHSGLWVAWPRIWIQSLDARWWRVLACSRRH